MNNDALAHNIRGWVHYDNMTTSLQKQVVNARKQRDTFEDQVRSHLIQNKIPSAVIQVSGGKLQLQEEKTTSSVTMKSLIESTQSFFRGHPEIPNGAKLATELVEHIKNERTTSTSLRLKKLKV
jgi:hypothetical protein|uniref:Uncharacterized protein n=1 Tax=viral metagenome TaxID=1070528 RepID=A0A6C0K3K4_9ZZZZ